MKKNLKSIYSLLLTAVLIVSMMPVASFADSNTATDYSRFKEGSGYVYIGDSFARGYAATNENETKIIDTSSGNDIVKENGKFKYAVNTVSSYPYYIADRLNLSPGHDCAITKDTHFWPLAYNAFSTSAMLGLIGADDSIISDYCLHQNRNPESRYNYLYECYGDGNSFSGTGIKDATKVPALKSIPELLQTASLVTIELGMADVIYKLQSDVEAEMKAGLSLNPEALAALLEKLVKNYKSYYNSWAKSYQVLVDNVKENTSKGNAQVVLVGIMNPLANVVISDDVLVPFGSLFNLLTDRMNTVIKKCAEENGFIYIDINNVDAPATMKSKPLTVSAVFKLLENSDAVAIATHPSTEGYEQIGRMIIAAVDKKIAKETAQAAGQQTKAVSEDTTITVDIGRFDKVDCVKVNDVKYGGYTVNNHELSVPYGNTNGETLKVYVVKDDQTTTLQKYTLKYSEKSGYTARRVFVTNDLKTTVDTVKNAPKKIVGKIVSLIKGLF